MGANEPRVVNNGRKALGLAMSVQTIHTTTKNQVMSQNKNLSQRTKKWQRHNAYKAHFHVLWVGQVIHMAEHVKPRG